MGRIKYPRRGFYSVKFAYNCIGIYSLIRKSTVEVMSLSSKLWITISHLRAYQPHVCWILTLSCYLLSHDQRYENNCNYNKIAVLFFISYVCFSHNIILLWNIFSTVFLSGVYKPNWLEIQDNITSNPFQLLDFWKNLFLFIYGLQSYRSH